MNEPEREALERIAQMQPEALRIIERNGFVFEDIGSEPGNWQHLAFTLYSTLCEAEWLARTTLEGMDERLSFSSKESSTF